jgi:MFS family permease
MSNKWLKFTFFAILLIGAGYFFGTICRQIGQAYDLILSPSGELLYLILWLLLSLGGLMVASGLVAALLRPLWIGIIAFILSGLAMLLGWRQVTIGNGILILGYLLVAFFYAFVVARELNERIRFSVRPISEGQNILLMVLILVICGSLYFGCVARIEKEGFSPPQFYIKMFMEQMEKQIEARVPAKERQEVITQFRKEFQRTVDEFFKSTVKPYEKYIPLAIIAVLFMPLVTVTRLLVWVPTLLMSLRQWAQ